MLSCDSKSSSSDTSNGGTSVQNDEYESCGSTYLYYDTDGKLENMGEGDVYTKKGNVYVHLYDKVYTVYKNNNGNGHPSYILFNGKTKVYTDVSLY